MDGAAKFVRGDAIAGILIVGINIVGGIIIGVVQRDMAFGDAMETFTRLTVGDGLVSQIPALIVSTAAGMLVLSGSSSQPPIAYLAIPTTEFQWPIRQPRSTMCLNISI